MSNTGIATHLFIGMGTVKTHVTRLLAKLDARDRVHLVAAACLPARLTGGTVTRPVS